MRAINSPRPFLERIYWIAERLRSNRPINCTAIARRFEISAKTAQRDMEFLRDRLRYDISYDRQARSFTLTSVPEPIL
jgi:predicted DNA-binding transcriptional regulator YafY